jgi:hypothetical protein
MAHPTAVNSQITDSITQANTKVLGDAPAMGMGNLFIATSQALSNSAQNATFAQNQGWTTMQTATTQGVAGLLTLDTAAVGRAAEAISRAPFA